MAVYIQPFKVQTFKKRVVHQSREKSSSRLLFNLIVEQKSRLLFVLA